MNKIIPSCPSESHKGCLNLWGLEPSVSKLGAGVDELEIKLLKSPLLGVFPEGVRTRFLGPMQHPSRG